MCGSPTVKGEVMSNELPPPQRCCDSCGALKPADELVEQDTKYGRVVLCKDALGCVLRPPRIGQP
jgi:hypothetical protein